VSSRALERVNFSVEIEISVSRIHEQAIKKSIRASNAHSLLSLCVCVRSKCDPFRSAQLAPLEDKTGAPSKGSIAEAFSP
jgi:hypothetical protein